MIPDGRHNGPFAVVRKWAGLATKWTHEHKAESAHLFNDPECHIVPWQLNMYENEVRPLAAEMSRDGMASFGDLHVINYGNKGKVSSRRRRSGAAVCATCSCAPCGPALSRPL